MNEPVARCDLCKQPLDDGEAVELWKWVLHPDCKEEADRRLMRFWDYLMSDEFEAECEAVLGETSEVL